MPELSPEMIARLQEIAARYLTAEIPQAEIDPSKTRAGGSAAVFKVSTPNQPEALKILNPDFLAGTGSEAEQHRVNLQKRLIGHDCDSLIGVHDVQFFEDTCICRMEYLEWRELKECITDFPVENIQGILDQLVSAVQHLAELGLVHRDIKPENILISSNLDRIKLVDFGVVREISEEEDRIDGTDIGDQRPFLATAQYSPPEYLFRTIEPSEGLWEALNLYQIGAVLHDLIARSPIFDEEMLTGNRYRVALAVHQKRPILSASADPKTQRLSDLCERCLVKDPSLRSDLITLDDFSEPSTNSPADQLKLVIGQTKLRAQQESGLSIKTNEIKLSLSDRLNSLMESIVGQIVSQFGADLKCVLRPRDALDLQRSIIATAPSGKEVSILIEIDLDPDIERKQYPIIIYQEGAIEAKRSCGFLDPENEIPGSLVQKTFDLVCGFVVENNEVDSTPIPDT